MFASIDLGGTTIGALIATSDGRILGERAIPTQSAEGPQAVLERIAQLVNSLAAEAGAHPKGLGMGAPGLIDLETGRSLFLPNLATQWRDIPIAGILSPLVGCPVRVLNDARLATLGELHYGHGRTARNMIYFTLGTGIGGGVVIDGKLRLGPFGAAGELGHQTIDPNGPLCGCGNRGCLETLAAAPAVTAEGVRLLRSGLAGKLHEITGGNADLVNPKTMIEAARAGEASVEAAIVRAARYLGIGAANLVTALHPELVVLSGGMSAIGDLLTATVRDEIRKRVRMVPTDGIRVEISQLGDKAGAWGGIALAAQSL